MEHRNGKPSTALSDTVDYSLVLQNGVPRDVLESLLSEHNREKQSEITTLRTQLGDLTASLEQMRAHPTGGGGPGDIRAEVVQLRQELAAAIASIRGLLVDADGDLHEMQLTALRRQMSQLEGVLESNYQRELRVAEERESALRSEMAQMRQDLRVALETLYRMPAEADGSSNVDGLKELENQISEVGSSLVRASNEQQRAALDRESNLKSELAHMRRDLLVTLEASYQLPTERLEGLDAQVASWRGQVEELQTLILSMQESQDEAALRHRIALQDEMRQLGLNMQTVLESSLPQSMQDELVQQRNVLASLTERLEAQSSGSVHTFEQFSEVVSEKTSALEHQFTRAHLELQTGLEKLALRMEEKPESPELVAVETLQERVAALHATVMASENRSTGLVQEWEQHVIAEISTLRSDLQSSIRDLSDSQETASDHVDQQAVEKIQGQFDELRQAITAADERRAALSEERQRALETTVGGEIAHLRADVLSVVDTLASARTEPIAEAERELLLGLEQRLREGMAEFTRHSDPVLGLLAERELALKDEIAGLREAIASMQESSTTAEPDMGRGSIELAELQSSFAALADNVSKIREEQRELWGAHGKAVHEELVASQDVLLEASIAIRDAVPGVPLLTAEAVSEIVNGKVDELQSHWSNTQNEQYRQLISQVAELQSDLDNVNTGMQAIQPVDDTDADRDSSLLNQVHQLLAALQTREADGENAGSIDELNRLRYEIQGLRGDLRTAAEVEATVAEGKAAGPQGFSLDDVVRVVAAQMNAGRAEGDRLAANRDNVLRHELSQIRQEVQTAVQQVRAQAGNGAPVDFADIHAVMAELRAGLAGIPASHDSDTVAELSQLHHDVRAVLTAMQTDAQSPRTDQNQDHDPLVARMDELELALQRSHEEQKLWFEERESTLTHQLTELRSSVNTAVTDTRPQLDDAREARDEEWQTAFARLSDEISALARQGEAPAAHDDSPILEQMTELRRELRQALERVHEADATSEATVSDSPAVHDGLSALATLLQQSAANQERMVESQQKSLQAALTQMREEMQSALSGLTRDGVDTFEKRQSQLRMDQLEMERNLAQLRQELVATHADPGNKKKLWR